MKDVSWLLYMTVLRIGPRRIWLVEETLYTDQDSCHVIGRAPPILQYVETEFATGVDIAVEDL